MGIKKYLKKIIVKGFFLYLFFIVLISFMNPLTVKATIPKDDSKVEDVETNSNMKVEDIEIENIEEDLEVGKTVTISASVVPAEASSNKIVYKSSNPSIATVSSTGIVKGISKGSVIITVSAGSVVKRISIKVKVKTTCMKLNKDYIILKKGEKFKIKTSIFPKEANQSVNFSSTDSKKVAVSSDGTVKGISNGTATIIISNGDSSTAASVIVNENAKEKVNDSKKESNAISENKSLLDSDSKITKINAKDNPIINSDTLYDLYVTENKLSVEGDGYSILIDGKNIANYNNEMLTDINLKSKEDKICFCINDNDYLCGDIILKINNIKGKYLYLYNTSKNKYELIETTDLSTIRISSAGKYMITASKVIIFNRVMVFGLIIGGVLLFIGMLVYICLKKKYWFW